MCRNIRPLYNYDPPTSPDGVSAAALQYVRKVSGMQRPSAANQAAFDDAIAEIARATEALLERLVTTAAPRDRTLDIERRKARAAERFRPAV